MTFKLESFFYVLLFFCQTILEVRLLSIHRQALVKYLLPLIKSAFENFPLSFSIPLRNVRIERRRSRLFHYENCGNGPAETA